ncbi:protein-glutamate O-methyltransferase CheR [Sphingomonas koreensis]|nr:protein-glutamate O-methyltransferase CheR [Sphingomonas koreensis]TPG43084.1 protein-glutamate O-methyltransferase CheR [Sphingomonas koreensis]
MIAPLPDTARSGALNVLAALLESRTGQQIAANREWRMETSLKPLLRDRGIDSLDALVGKLLDGRNPDLGDKVVDALLNQESSFYRDTAVFEMIAEAVTGLDKLALGRRIRIWSAGCATGQEPLSLAMLFAEREEAGGSPCPEILATDVSEAALARGRAGRYSQFEIQRGLPIRRMMRWFDAVDSDWVARPELVRRVQFKRHNLVSDPPPIGRFDIVLCRNVLFYLSQPLRRQIFERLAEVIRPGGLLVLGAGETVIGQTAAFAPSGRFKGLYEATGVRHSGGASVAA